MEQTCIECYISLFRPSALKMVEKFYSSYNFDKFLRNSNLMLKEKFMTILPRSPIWDWILEPAKNLSYLGHISETIENQDLKFPHEFHQYLCSTWLKFELLKLIIEKNYRKNSKIRCLKQRNHRIQSYDTKCTYKHTKYKYLPILHS